MIARHWRGWTKPETADVYEQLLKQNILPGIGKIEGHRGAWILRQDGPEESEFVVINFFNSLDAVRRFAGENYTVAVFEPEARALLSRIETVANHYQVRLSPEGAIRS